VAEGARAKFGETRGGLSGVVGLALRLRRTFRGKAVVDKESLRARYSGLSTNDLRNIIGSPDFSDLARAVARELLEGRAGHVPAHPCAVHLEEEVVGTCARCGLFICAACDPAWERVKSGHCPTCQARAPHSSLRPRAFGCLALSMAGWFMLAVRLMLSGHWPVGLGAAVVGLLWLIRLRTR
jgi:hypothetical protein